MGDGPATGKLAEAAFALRMGWTWNELMEAPEDFLRRVMALMNAEAEQTRSKES